jgi:cytochrome c553
MAAACAAACVFAWVAAAIAAAATDDPEIRAAEAWAFPVPNTPDPSAPELAHAPKPDAHEALHVAGSQRTYTRAQIDVFNPPDWFPQDHPPMPQVVGHGRKPAFACAYCHMPDGEPEPAGAAIAGLPEAYILEQVAAFRSGERGTSQLPSIRAMAAEAHWVTDADLQQAAAYFSKLRFVPRTRVVETETVPRTHWQDYVLMPDKHTAREPLGERIIEVPVNVRDYMNRDHRDGFIAYVPPGSIARGAGIASKGNGAAQACESCHGADLQGAGMYPPLAGRSPTYIVRQLILFSTGQRNNAEAVPMKLEVSQLSVGDMIDVAAYAASRKP